MAVSSSWDFGNSDELYFHWESEVYKSLIDKLTISKTKVHILCANNQPLMDAFYKSRISAKCAANQIIQVNNCERKGT